jgi:hypothetical protein
VNSRIHCWVVRGTGRFADLMAALCKNPNMDILNDFKFKALHGLDCKAKEKAISELKNKMQKEAEIDLLHDSAKKIQRIRRGSIVRKQDCSALAAASNVTKAEAREERQREIAEREAKTSQASRDSSVVRQADSDGAAHASPAPDSSRAIIESKEKSIAQTKEDIAKLEAEVRDGEDKVAMYLAICRSPLLHVFDLEKDSFEEIIAELQTME